MFLMTPHKCLPPLSCYRSSLPIQMRDMGHEDEENDDDDNNNNDDDDDNGGDHVCQQQHTQNYT